MWIRRGMGMGRGWGGGGECYEGRMGVWMVMRGWKGGGWEDLLSKALRLLAVLKAKLVHIHHGPTGQASRARHERTYTRRSNP